mgnify:CR=1 FL=1
MVWIPTNTVGHNTPMPYTTQQPTLIEADNDGD